MREIWAETAAVDETACRVVHFKTTERPAGRDRFGDALDGGITGAGHDSEYIANGIAGLIAAEAGPGDVVIDRARLIELGPHIQQHEIAGPDGRRRFFARFVMR